MPVLCPIKSNRSPIVLMLGAHVRGAKGEHVRGQTGEDIGAACDGEITGAALTFQTQKQCEQEDTANWRELQPKGGMGFRRPGEDAGRKGLVSRVRALRVRGENALPQLRRGAAWDPGLQLFLQWIRVVHTLHLSNRPAAFAGRTDTGLPPCWATFQGAGRFLQTCIHAKF